MVLGAVGENDLLIGPVGAVGEEQSLAQQGRAELLISLIPKAEGESRQARALLAHLNGKEIRQVATSQNLLHLLLHPLDGWRSPPGIVAAIGEPDPEFLQFPLALGDLARKGLRLGVEELLVEGAQDGALDSEDHFTGPVGPDGRELGGIESVHHFA